MSNYIVSARKYRPKRFSEVVGQDQVTTTLRNALKTDQLAQAFLFTGPRGVGKTTCARILAKVINCENPVDNYDACETADEGDGFYIFELDAASNNSVDDIRALIEQVRFVPPAGKKKVYIIDEVHMLSANAFNAFLKTLEEPPPYAIFILATTEKHKILPTILSRCQIYDFNRISDSDIVDHLKVIAKEEKIEADDNALHVIALKADGALRDALSIFDMMANFGNGKVSYEDTLKNLNVLDYDVYFRMTEAMLSEDTASILNFFDEVSARGLAGDHFINGLAGHFRNLLVSQHPDTLKLLESSEDFKKKYANQAKVISGDWLLTALNHCNSCDIGYKTAKNKRLHIEMTLLKLCHIHRVLNWDFDALPRTSGESKKKQSKTKQESSESKLTQTTISEKNEEEPLSKGNQAILEKKDSNDGSENIDSSKPLEEKEVSAKVEKKEIVQETIESPKGKLKRKTELKSDIVIPKNLTALHGNVIKTEKKKEKLAEAFTESDLENAWSTYTSKYEADGGESIVVNLLTESKRILNEAEIEMTVAYAFDVEKLAGVRLDIVDHLKKVLRNDNITLKINVNEELATKKEREPFTTKEKYEAMVKKNPMLKKLKDQLNLELDI